MYVYFIPLIKKKTILIIYLLIVKFRILVLFPAQLYKINYNAHTNKERLVHAVSIQNTP